MDKQLYKVSEKGKVEVFIERCETGKYFFPDKIQSNKGRNLLHLASRNGHLEFVIEVLKRLPVHLVCQPDKKDFENPLHYAARKGHLEIAKRLVDAYKSSTHDPAVNNLTSNHESIVRAIESAGGVLSSPPWRARNRFCHTPVHVAALSGHEHVVTYLLELEPNFLSDVDADCSSLLREAAFGGCKQIAKIILTSGVSYSTAKIDLKSIIELATNCSESDAVLLLKQHSELVECRYETEWDPRQNSAAVKDPKGKTILHSAAECNWVEVTQTVLNTNDSIARIVDKNNQNPLHVAAYHDNFEIAQLLIDAFNKSSDNVREELQGQILTGARGQDDDVSADLSIKPPWRDVDINRCTPLHLALMKRHRRIAKLILQSDLAFLCKMVNEYNQSPPSLLMEVANNVKLDDQSSLMGIFLVTFYRFLKDKLNNKPDQDATRKFIKHYPELIRYNGGYGRTILQYALDENDVDLISFILNIDPSAIDINDDQGKLEHLLIRACRKVNVPAIQTICRICPEAAQYRGRQDQATALHHVGEKKGAKTYKKLLDIPQIANIKNYIDINDRTPLMKAIQENNLPLAKTLLKLKGIDTLDLKNKEGKTAAEMLKNKSKEEPKWNNLYEEASANVNSHFPLGTDLKEMRSTLSIVAALLATITFAAAFTVPGGFNQDNGYVIFGQKASFIAFLLLDTYAMCCSMIVLSSLIWATYQDSDRASKTIAGSIIVLHQSLYGTMGAFMAGVYTMMSSKSIWVAIVILFMCSIVVIFAFMLIILKYVAKFIGKLKNVGKEKEEEDIELGETFLEYASGSTRRRGGVQILEEGNSNRRSSVPRTRNLTDRAGRILI